MRRWREGLRALLWVPPVGVPQERTHAQNARLALVGSFPLTEPAPYVDLARRHGISRSVAAQSLALVVLISTAGVQIAHGRADLAAELGGGPVVAVAPVVRRASPPVALRIPKLGFGTRLVGLRTERNGTLEVPADFSRAGWWSDGPAPGDAAPAIIAGHVDDQDGPAVFSRIDELVKGDRLQVRRADGTVITFEVRQVHTYAKRSFPTRLVYEGNVGQPALRLITCGGDFDRSTGHYRSNTVVFAALIPNAVVPQATPKPKPNAKATPAVTRRAA